MTIRPLLLAALVGIIFLCGCGGPKATVSGRVICSGKPVSGGIMFSPKGDDPANTAQAVNAVLDADGRYSLKLFSIGSHRVQISPSDRPPPPKLYPCDLKAVERDVIVGVNEINIDLGK